MSERQPSLGDLIRSDAQCHGDWGSALPNLGFCAAFHYRVAHWLHRNGWDLLGRLVQLAGLMITGADISRKARIGQSLGIYHPQAILVGPGVVIGDRCNLHQGCALVPDTWTVRSDDVAFPVVEDQVYIGAGAKVLGGVTVGFDARVAPNSLVLKDVPPNATALGVPARMIPAQFRHDEPE